MRAFVLSIFVSILALGFVPSYETAVSSWKKRSSCLPDLFCCHRAQSEPNALENLMPRPKGGTKETEILLSPSIIESDVLTPTKIEIEGDEPVIKYEQSSPYRVGLDRDNEIQIDIITQADPDDGEGIWNFSPCDNQLGYRLPFEENGHTFMTWDWGTANWFFTATLTGCDMFVAKKEGEQSKALIIHGNLNKYSAPRQQIDNFRIKGEMAEKIVNSDSFRNYRLVMRVYARPTCPAAVTFIEEYKSAHSSPGSKIFLYGYDADNFPDGHLFFGKDGKFYVKAKIGGETRELKANLE